MMSTTEAVAQADQRWSGPPIAPCSPKSGHARATASLWANDPALDQTSARSHQPELSASHQICSVKSRDALDKSVYVQQAR